MAQEKKYIKVRGSIHQDIVDNGLLMVDSYHLSSDAKIVYLVLKKMQNSNGSSQTDAHSWFKISGLGMGAVNAALKQLEKFGLIECYFSARNLRDFRTVCTNYLLDHEILNGRYQVIECPHDGESIPDPLNPDNILKVSAVASRIKKFSDSLDKAVTNQEDLNHEHE